MRPAAREPKQLPLALEGEGRQGSFRQADEQAR